MEEQTLDVHVPSVAEALAILLTENNFTDEAEKIRDSFTPKALTDYCDAFFQSLVGPRVDLSNFQRARNFLRLRTEDKLIEKMKAILDAHDISLEYFKTKVINSLGRMPGVGSEIIKGVPQFLNPELSSASFLELISQIINDHA
ncbi:MAG TPA: hypothetical protein VGU44_01965, partial [Gammaproteobacteria bacterium]|nr:hypothetical protein [Gammaproteobacteria bacterium]